MSDTSRKALLTALARQASGRYGAGLWHTHPDGCDVMYVSPGHWRARRETMTPEHTTTTLASGGTMAHAVENLAKAQAKP